MRQSTFWGEYDGAILSMRTDHIRCRVIPISVRLTISVGVSLNQLTDHLLFMRGGMSPRERTPLHRGVGCLFKIGGSGAGGDWIPLPTHLKRALATPLTITDFCILPTLAHKNKTIVTGIGRATSLVKLR